MNLRHSLYLKRPQWRFGTIIIAGSSSEQRLTPRFPAEPTSLRNRIRRRDTPVQGGLYINVTRRRKQWGGWGQVINRHWATSLPLHLNEIGCLPPAGILVKSENATLSSCCCVLYIGYRCLLWNGIKVYFNIIREREREREGEGVR